MQRTIFRSTLLALFVLSLLSGCDSGNRRRSQNRDANTGQGVQKCLDESECNDLNPCTDDACVLGACKNTPISNGAACGMRDSLVCQDGECTGCEENSDGCDSGSSCVEATCKNNSCVFEANSGQSCDKIEGGVCNNQGTCVSCIEDGQCDDSNECTEDTCVAGECLNKPAKQDTSCGNEDYLTCNADGQCQGCKSKVDCDDDNLCTIDECNDKVCSNTPDPKTQSSRVACDPDDSSKYCSAAGACVICETFAECDDGNPCSEDRCDKGACIFDKAAKNGDLCGGGNICADGVCVGCTPNSSNCDDENACTTDLCTNALVCDFVADKVDQACGTNKICTAQGTCRECNRADQCSHMGAPGVCSYYSCESNACNLNHRPETSTCGSNKWCNGSGECIGCNSTHPCAQPANDCQVATCAATGCSNSNKTKGVDCNFGGVGGECNGEGACQRCVNDGHCKTAESAGLCLDQKKCVRMCEIEYNPPPGAQYVPPAVYFAHGVTTYPTGWLDRDISFPRPGQPFAARVQIEQKDAGSLTNIRLRVGDKYGVFYGKEAYDTGFNKVHLWYFRFEGSNVIAAPGLHTVKVSIDGASIPSCKQDVLNP